MKSRWLVWSRWVVLVMAAMPLFQAGGCALFTNRVLGGVANQLPSTLFNIGLQIIISIFTGTSNFLFQSGGQFGGGFGS